MDRSLFFLKWSTAFCMYGIWLITWWQGQLLNKSAGFLKACSQLPRHTYQSIVNLCFSPTTPLIIADSELWPISFPWYSEKKVDFQIQLVKIRTGSPHAVFYMAVMLVTEKGELLKADPSKSGWQMRSNSYPFTFGWLFWEFHKWR